MKACPLGLLLLTFAVSFAAPPRHRSVAEQINYSRSKDLRGIKEFSLHVTLGEIAVKRTLSDQDSAALENLIRKDFERRLAEQEIRIVSEKEQKAREEDGEDVAGNATIGQIFVSYRWNDIRWDALGSDVACFRVIEVKVVAWMKNPRTGDDSLSVVWDKSTEEGFRAGAGRGVAHDVVADLVKSFALDYLRAHK